MREVAWYFWRMMRVYCSHRRSIGSVVSFDCAAILAVVNVAGARHSTRDIWRGQPGARTAFALIQCPRMVVVVVLGAFRVAISWLT